MSGDTSFLTILNSCIAMAGKTRVNSFSYKSSFPKSFLFCINKRTTLKTKQDLWFKQSIILKWLAWQCCYMFLHVLRRCRISKMKHHCISAKPTIYRRENDNHCMKELWFDKFAFVYKGRQKQHEYVTNLAHVSVHRMHPMQDLFYCRLPFINVLFFVALCLLQVAVKASGTNPVLHFAVSMLDPASHYFQVELTSQGRTSDTVDFKMPKWTTGYYQLMGYANAVKNISAKDEAGRTMGVQQLNENTWRVVGHKNKAIKLSYRVLADKQFVANPFLDSTHAYLVPSGLFVYANGFLHTPVSLAIILPKQWNKIATGLEPIAGKKTEFFVPDFDILYDSPLLVGNLEELPSFTVGGVEHRFVGYQLGEFDRKTFMQNLKRVVETAVRVIGDIPYKHYTFIAIGSGRGGIEHLNSTTVSFDGKDLSSAGGMNTMMNFLAHEYFHHYNVKRIRPLELGPFNYDEEARTNLLWLSEGLSVYYEYMIVKRAGLIDGKTLFKNFESSINAFENDPGRTYQSLVQASYQTWQDGPFGNRDAEDKAISYYEKGPVVGLVLDFAIRRASNNRKSLDDVMRQLYWRYYKGLHRGVTDAEVQQACEDVAGSSLVSVFDYVYTTKPLDYATYMAYAGLRLDTETDASTGKKRFFLHQLDKTTPEQQVLLQAWLGY